MFHRPRHLQMAQEKSNLALERSDIETDVGEISKRNVKRNERYIIDDSLDSDPFPLSGSEQEKS